MTLRYNILNLQAYINWTYFYHSWSVKEGTPEADRLHSDAVAMLHELAPRFEAQAVFELYDCWSENDDILLLSPGNCPCLTCRQNPEVIATLPMLRQQHPDSDGFCWSISDFIRSKEQIQRKQALHPTATAYDRIVLFATTFNAPSTGSDTDSGNCTDSDPYTIMLRQTLSDRLAEAAAERLHEQVRRQWWGYAPDENLTPQQLFHCQYTGIRPAVGYPCMPDLSLNFTLDTLLHFDSIGITLTEKAMMQPHASVSGLMIAHPKARYFSVGDIGEDQLQDYSRRRGMDTRTYLHINT